IKMAPRGNCGPAKGILASKPKTWSARKVAGFLNSVINKSGGLYCGSYRVRCASSSFGEVLVTLSNGNTIPFRGEMLDDVRDYHGQPLPSYVMKAAKAVVDSHKGAPL